MINVDILDKLIKDDINNKLSENIKSEHFRYDEYIINKYLYDENIDFYIFNLCLNLREKFFGNIIDMINDNNYHIDVDIAATKNDLNLYIEYFNKLFKRELEYLHGFEFIIGDDRLSKSNNLNLADNMMTVPIINISLKRKNNYEYVYGVNNPNKYLNFNIISYFDKDIYIGKENFSNLEKNLLISNLQYKVNDIKFKFLYKDSNYNKKNLHL